MALWPSPRPALPEVSRPLGRVRLWRGLRSLGGPGHWRTERGAAFVSAYVQSYSHRVPLLFLVACFGVVVLALRFAGTAPWPLLAVAPVLCVYAVWRAAYWLPWRVARRPLVRLEADIARMARMANISGLLFVTWALVLFGYGDMAQRALVHYVVAVTMLAAILGLAHAPQPALRLAVVFTVPSTLVFMLDNHPNAVFVSLMQVCLTVVFLFVTHGHHRDFVRLELSRQKLARREKQAARLAESHFVQASIDPLTGVMNRRAILARVKEELTRENSPGWLALVDLDGFKHVNDTYGHAAGDDVLRAVATRIGKTPGVLAHGRLGGDEFAILFDGHLDGKAVARAAHQLSTAIREPISHSTVTLRLYGSIGIYRVRDAGVSGCLERADAALYKAKKRGEGAIVLFGPDDEIALQRRIAMTRQFNDCALGDRLRLLYQPMIDIETGHAVSYEAYARWSPDGVNWLAPAEFMPMAEATGRTGELTRAVLARALAECPVWQQGLTLGINLAPRDLVRDGAVEAFTEIVREAGALPQAVTLEVTESALQADPRRAMACLQSFRDQGFRIALDDFGAGWSGLSQLRDMPLDLIKIDRALAQALATDAGARAIASTIVTLAWQLGFDCTIEGIEDEAQVATARALGIRLMQGYHFGRPEIAAQTLATLGRAVA